MIPQPGIITHDKSIYRPATFIIPIVPRRVYNIFLERRYKIRIRYLGCQCHWPMALTAFLRKSPVPSANDTGNIFTGRQCRRPTTLATFRRRLPVPSSNDAGNVFRKPPVPLSNDAGNYFSLAGCQCHCPTMLVTSHRKSPVLSSSDTGSYCSLAGCQCHCPTTLATFFASLQCRQPTTLAIIFTGKSPVPSSNGTGNICFASLQCCRPMALTAIVHSQVASAVVERRWQYFS